MENKLIIAGIVIGDRTNTASKVQEVLTKYSDIIFCRMGVSDLTNYCRLGDANVPQDGVISLTINGPETKVKEMVQVVEGIAPGISMKYLVLK